MLSPSLIVFFPINNFFSNITQSPLVLKHLSFERLVLHQTQTMQKSKRATNGQACCALSGRCRSMSTNKPKCYKMLWWKYRKYLITETVVQRFGIDNYNWVFTRFRVLLSTKMRKPGNGTNIFMPVLIWCFLTNFSFSSVILSEAKCAGVDNYAFCMSHYPSDLLLRPQAFRSFGLW